jgi:hypothetical protein
MNIETINGGTYTHRLNFSEPVFVDHAGNNLLDGANCLCLTRFDQKVNCERFLGTYFILDEYGMLGESYGMVTIEFPLDLIKQLILNNNETF